MSANMPIKSIPVCIAYGFGRQSGFPAIGGEQAIDIVFQKGLDVQVAGMFEGALD